MVLFLVNVNACMCSLVKPSKLERELNTRRKLVHSAGVIKPSWYRGFVSGNTAVVCHRPTGDLVRFTSHHVYKRRLFRPSLSPQM